MNRRDGIKSIVLDIMQCIDDAEFYEREYQQMKVTAAKYKALFYGRDGISKKLCDQESENRDACIGAFDGFCYSSKRAVARFRTLDDMKNEGILDADEFAFCDVI